MNDEWNTYLPLCPRCKSPVEITVERYRATATCSDDNQTGCEYEWSSDL